MSISNPPRMTGTKLCAGECKRDLPVINFAVNAATSDGLNPICRDCDSVYRGRLRAKKRTLAVRRRRDTLNPYGPLGDRT